MDIVNSLIQDQVLAHHHVASYVIWHRHLLEETLLNYVFKSAHEGIQWKIVDVRLKEPTITPQAAIDGCAPYEASVVVDVEENREGVYSGTLKDIVIATLPAMVLPRVLHPKDPGGWFILNNIERVLVTQIRLAYNYPMVRRAKKDAKKNRIRAELTFAPHKFDTIEYLLDIRSISEATGHSCATELALTEQGQILFSNSKIVGRMTLGVMMKALGCIDLESYKWAVSGDEELAKVLFFSALHLKDQDAALDYISSSIKLTQKTASGILTRETASRLLTDEFFPHLGKFSGEDTVCLYMGHLAKTIFSAARTGREDSRDSIKFKRYEAAGVLMGDLFKQIIKKWASTLEKHCLKRGDFITGVQDVYTSRRVHYCFSSGLWGALMSSYKRVGVSQPRAYTSYTGYLSHLQRISNPISKETKNQLVRQLHPSQMGYICPCETPEGHTVGIVLNMAATATISTKTPPILVIDAIQQYLSPVKRKRSFGYLVFVNGKLVGTTQDAIGFYGNFTKLRRLGVFSGGLERGKVSIGIEGACINIWCDEGRLVRLVKTPEFRKCSSWAEGLKKGYLQWIDAYEEEFGFDKMSENREIDPSLALGLSAATIPFINRQPSPRSVYATNMCKQAVSNLGPGQKHKFATNINFGHNKDHPLLTTEISKMFGLDDYPPGNNCIIAVAPFHGYNQEDSIVVNKASIQRGLFSSISLRTVFAEEENEGDVFKIVKVPELSEQQKALNYCVLDDMGVVRKGEKVFYGDVLVGMIAVSKNGKVSDCSVFYEKHEPAIVYNVHVSDLTSYKKIKVVLAVNLEVSVGDKFASRHGQKHTIGKIVDYTDMPYGEDGLVPDMIMSPLALPSRATPTILEGLVNIKALEDGEVKVINSFDRTITIEKKGSILLRNAVDGEFMVPIFVAPIYYIRLPHFAAHKCYARAKGVMSRQTRQPTDGRSRLGGLRVGEMERDAIISLRMPHVLEDRFFHSSDKFWIYVCNLCGRRAINGEICMCGKSTSEEIQKVKMSFSSNLIFNQLQALGCKIVFGLQNTQVSSTPTLPTAVREESVIEETDEGGSEDGEETDEGGSSCEESGDEVEQL